MQSIEIYGDGIGRVDLVDHMGDDLRVVNAARTSYNKQKSVLDDSDRKLIKYLLVNKHTSPFEHNVFTIRCTVPLFVRSQHVRHRIWKFSEKSYRYSGENIQFYYPPCWRTQSKSNKQMSDQDIEHPAMDAMVRSHCEECREKYEQMIEAGIAREMARMILPQNLYTEYYGTIDLHNAFHFISLRLHPHAQWEIQRVAWAMKEILKGLYPEIMAIWEELHGNAATPIHS